MNPIRLYKIIRFNIIRIFAYALVAALITFFIGSTMLQYEATATVSIRPLGQELINNPANFQIGVLSSPLMHILQDWRNSYINLMTNRNVIAEVSRRLALDNKTESKQPTNNRFLEIVINFLRTLFYGKAPLTGTEYHRSLENLKNQISVDFLYNSSSLRVTVGDRDASKAVNITNHLLDVFTEYSRERTIQNAKQIQVFIENQLDTTRKQILAEKAKQYQLKEEYGLHKFKNLDEEQTRVLNKLNSLEDKLEENKRKLTITEKKLERINAKLKNFPEFQRSSYTINANQTIDKLKERLFSLKLNKNKLLIDYTPDSLQVQSVEDEISIIENQIETELEQILAQETFQLNPLNQSLLKDKITNEIELEHLPYTNELHEIQINKYRQELSKLDIVNIELSKINLNLSSLLNQETALTENFNKTLMLVSRGASEVQVLEKAHKPRYPVLKGSPLIFYVLISSVISFILFSGIFALQSDLKGVLVEEKDIKHSEPGVPVVTYNSQIPKHHFFKKPVSNNRDKSKPYSYHLSKSNHQLKQLAIKLTGGPFRDSLDSKCIGICPDINIGSSLDFAYSLGKAFLNFGDRILILDCSHKKHSLDTVVKPHKKNIIELLINNPETPLDDILKTTDVQNIFLLPLDDTSFFFQTTTNQLNFEALIKTLKSQFNYIIILFPPLALHPEWLPFTGLNVINGNIITLQMFKSSKRIEQSLRNDIQTLGGKVIAYICIKQ